MPRSSGKQSTGRTGNGPAANTFYHQQQGMPDLMPREGDTVYGKVEEPEKLTDEADDDEKNG